MEPTPASVRAKAIIIEDDDAVRNALSRAIRDAPDLTISGTAAGYDEARSLLLSTDFDIMLVDLDLRGRSGIDLIRACREHSDAKVIVISVLGDEATVIRAIEAGADGYILKESAFGDLPSILRRLLRGEAPISPAVARHLLRRFQSEDTAGARNSSYALSRRERQVLQELARGASYKEVAQKYELSIHTIGDYVKSLYKKLSVSSRGEAVNKAVRAGLIRM